MLLPQQNHGAAALHVEGGRRGDDGLFDDSDEVVFADGQTVGEGLDAAAAVDDFQIVHVMILCVMIHMIRVFMVASPAGA